MNIKPQYQTNKQVYTVAKGALERDLFDIALGEGSRTWTLPRKAILIARNIEAEEDFNDATSECTSCKVLIGGIITATNISNITTTEEEAYIRFKALASSLLSDLEKVINGEKESIVAAKQLYTLLTTE